METNKRLLHTARLNNNCPECFGTEGLELKFFQSEKEYFFSKKFSPIQHELYCHKCKSEIFRSHWDEDIERVYEYHKKIANSYLQESKTKLILWAFVLISCLIIVIGIYFAIA